MVVSKVPVWLADGSYPGAAIDVRGMTTILYETREERSTSQLCLDLGGVGPLGGWVEQVLGKEPGIGDCLAGAIRRFTRCIRIAN